ncbi:CD82 antigen-like [Heterodontus francisci]|uniref:CD82 antigen-like n=1 Tax=Heterodontus francisci TaxID=7792 RepID=UPI00355B9A60
MGKGCIKVTKYFLFLFNLLFFILGAVILGFGLWILLDDTSFIAVLQSSSSSLKIGSYMLLGVGSVTMLMGFLGCLGAVNEIKCLLCLYFTCLLLILIAQITAGVLIYFQRDLLKAEIAEIIHQTIVNYNPEENTEKSFGTTWDYIQKKLKCCGWVGPSNWTENLIIRNSSVPLFPCSCYNKNVTMLVTGFCEGGQPVYGKGCSSTVEEWLYSNIGIIFGVCIGVAVIELLGMVLSMCLCKKVQQEDYSKVSKD